MNSNVKQSLDNLEVVFSVVEEELTNWNSDKCMQFKNLLSVLTDKLNWTEEDCRRYDHVVRYYVWKHPEWTSVRGAKGGITKRDKVDQKRAAKLAQSSIKAELEAKIEAALSNASVATSISSSEDEDIEDFDLGELDE